MMLLVWYLFGVWCLVFGVWCLVFVCCLCFLFELVIRVSIVGKAAGATSRQGLSRTLWGGTRFVICNHCEMGHWRNGGDCEFYHVNTGYPVGLLARQNCVARS